MTWIEDEKRFLNREERQERIDLYSEYLGKIKHDHNVEELGDLPDEVLTDIYPIIKELKRLKRVHRSEIDLLYFSWEYFSENGNPSNQGNWQGFDLERPEDATNFHKEICSIMDHVSNVEKNSKTCTAAPRGHGKSTYLSRAFPLREILFRKRKYIITISLDLGLTQGNLEWIAMQLKHNKKLQEDFGGILSAKKQENPKDNMDEFITWYTDIDGNVQMLTKCEAATSGQALRGKNWNGNRPDLIVCDDLEDLEKNAGTPEQRDKVKNWYNSVVEALGDPRGKTTSIVYMGTTVHHECLLMDLLYKRGDYKTKIYKAIISPPERLDLWSECEQIYKDPNREISERVQAAHEFYLENQEEMEKGAVVLWPESKNLWELYKIKWERGSKPFSTEYMNNPIDEESQIFNIERDFTFYDGIAVNLPYSERKFKDGNYHIYFGCDFAMGKKERGDYSALTVLAKHKRTGTRYVVESYIEKIHPDKFLDHIVERAIFWQPDKIAADSNVAQEFLTYTLKQRLQAIGYPSFTRVVDVKDRSKKELRIEALKPDIVNGHIQFNRKHVRLLEQFEMFGTNTHDDGCDSLEMANSVSKSHNVEIMDKPWWL